MQYLTRADIELIADGVAARQHDVDPAAPSRAYLRGGGDALLESAVGEPQQTFFGEDLYPTVFDSRTEWQS